jgi:hypothetical protein
MSVNQLLAGPFEGVRERVAPEAGAEKQPTHSPYIQAYRTSVTKALKQADGPRKDAIIKAKRNEVQCRSDRVSAPQIAGHVS